MAKAKKGITIGDIYKELERMDYDPAKFSYLWVLSKRIGKDISLGPEDEKAFYKTLGDYAVATNNLYEAAEAYGNAGFKEGLIEIGNKFVEKGDLWGAEWAYEKIGKKLSKEQLIKIGDKAVEEGKFALAAEAYAKAGEEKKAMELRKKIAAMKK
jgi:tetratricopeptide (TPR) repeat protein